MLAMPEVNYIKHLRNNEDMNITDISNKLGRNWRTIKKYADGEVPNGTLRVNKRGMMYDEGFGEIVDFWLEEDMKLNRKDRRNNKNIYEQLVKEHGFKGSYRTVCDYIQLKKPQLKQQKETRYQRLEHPPGEAQVDFGNMTVVKDGQYKDLKILIMSFPYSNAAFAYPLPAENSECFLHGLKELFQQAGGVPTYLRIDNLSAAVVSVGKGEYRKYTDSFLRFQAHYGFEIQACNPARGNEKGNVEKKVDYTRCNFFVSAPIMKDFPTFTEWLKEKMVEDRNRQHYAKDKQINELWEEETKALKVLPIKDLAIYSIASSVVNKYGEITVDGENFVIHKAYIKQSVIIKKEWNSFSCIGEDGEILYQEMRPYMNIARKIPWDDIFGDWEKKPRSVRYSRYLTYLPERVKKYLILNGDETKSRVKGLRKLYKKYSFEEIDSLLENENFLERAPHELGFMLAAKKNTYPTSFVEAHTPSVLKDYETDLHSYDKRLFPNHERSVD